MKRYLFTFISAMMMLSSCGSWNSMTSSQAGRMYQDGIYASQANRQANKEARLYGNGNIKYFPSAKMLAANIANESAAYDQDINYTAYSYADVWNAAYETGYMDGWSGWYRPYWYSGWYDPYWNYGLFWNYSPYWSYGMYWSHGPYWHYGCYAPYWYDPWYYGPHYAYHCHYWGPGYYPHPGHPHHPGGGMKPEGGHRGPVHVSNVHSQSAGRHGSSYPSTRNTGTSRNENNASGRPSSGSNVRGSGGVRNAGPGTSYRVYDQSIGNKRQPSSNSQGNNRQNVRSTGYQRSSSSYEYQRSSNSSSYQRSSGSSDYSRSSNSSSYSRSSSSSYSGSGSSYSGGRSGGSSGGSSGGGRGRH